MQIMKIRRDKLFRLAQAGKLVAVGSYHYDEMSGEERSKGIAVPVRIKTSQEDFIEGCFNLTAFDFQSSSGTAWLSDDGKTACLYVHSNCNYDFRMADGSSFNAKPAPSMLGKRPENIRMQEFLASHGIEATVKYLADGSMRGCWRLHNGETKWTQELADKLNTLGFTDFDGGPLNCHPGNGGVFQVFVRGHNELLQADMQKMEAA